MNHAAQLDYTVFSKCIRSKSSEILAINNLDDFEKTFNTIFPTQLDNFIFFEIVNEEKEMDKDLLLHIYNHYINPKFYPSNDKKVYSKPMEAYKYKGYSPNSQDFKESEMLHYSLYH